MSDKVISSEVIKNEVLAIGLPDKEKFDSLIDGKKVNLFYLTNKNGLQASVTNYGARMVSLHVPDKTGKLTDIILGFNSLNGFMTSGEKYYGAIVGRYGNRIANGKFSLNGKNYKLDINNSPNSLHGGSTGFHSRIWDAIQPDSQSIKLNYVSVDGEEGYPGTVNTKVVYTLTDQNELKIDYEISTDKKTIINVTNHNFWNLNGEGNGTVNKHDLKIEATTYNAVDSTLIPIAIKPVSGTPFDFRTFHKIEERLVTDDLQIKYGKGYDHNFILDKGITVEPGLAATIKGDLSGIEMEIYTTEPGIQFYGGNFLEGLHTLRSGAKDNFRTAFCLETQHFPDSPNQPAFPSTVLEPGKVYKSSTIHKFNQLK
ncbi:MAG: aldose epimerase family protein [Chitinophagaceae bacterium]